MKVGGAAWWKYVAVLKESALTSLVYRGDVLIRSTTLAMIMFVFVQLWTTTFQLGGFTVAAGFTLASLLWYLVVTESSAPSLGETLIQRIGDEVKSGDFLRVLVRPYSYLGYWLGTYWGEQALRLPIATVFMAAVVWLAVGPPPTTPAWALMAAGSLAMSLLLNFGFGLAIALLAFWFEDTLPFYWIYQKLLFTIGGFFLPLELLPGWLAEFASKLPLAAIAYTPARIFVGVDPATAAGLMLVQAGWLVAVFVAVSAIYARAIRAVATHGG